jgi:hypothetical protein
LHRRAQVKHPKTALNEACSLPFPVKLRYPALHRTILT